MELYKNVCRCDVSSLRACNTEVRFIISELKFIISEATVNRAMLYGCASQIWVTRLKLKKKKSAKFHLTAIMNE